jgi:hypothetical protein
MRDGSPAERAWPSVPMKEAANDIGAVARIAAKGSVISDPIFVCAIRVELSLHTAISLMKNSGDGQ